MKFGPVPPNRIPQQDPAKVMLLAERWQRSTFAHDKWATPAKEAVDFFEGRQYTDAQLAALKRQKRPALKFNIIAPIVRLVAGYHANNKSDIQFSPGHDNRSTDDVAETLSKLEKAAASDNMLEFVDPDVFMMGLISGRGFYDTRLDWEKNNLGEIKTSYLSPFMVKVDPDADTYDLNESASFIQIDKMVSIDEIEAAFGKNVAELVRPWTMGQTPHSPVMSQVVNGEIAPVRYFGQREDADTSYWDNFYSLLGDFVDTRRKTIRLIETQHKVRELRNVMIDLETGDMKALPLDWGADKIQKALLYAQLVNNPCQVEVRAVERQQWTTMCGDLLLYDAPSLYEGYTTTGYFPYFREGFTRGMVEDLVDPQKEKNKSRSNRVEIESKTANGGWMYHQDSLTPVQKQKLQQFGSTPGVDIEWKGAVDGKPQQIQPSTPSQAYRNLENDSDQDIRRISGVNESALGDTDISNQSGRAIEARQRQAVVSVKTYMDNFRRTKLLLGRYNHLPIFQTYYTEERIYRVTGEDGKKAPIYINQLLLDPVSNTKRILNDLTIGKYSVTVDDGPLSPSFEAAQFDEAMLILAKLGPALGNYMPIFADLILGMSSLPRKQEWIDRLQKVMAAMGIPVDGDGAPVPGGMPMGAPGAAPGGAPPGGAPPLALPAQGGAPGMAPQAPPRPLGGSAPPAGASLAP